MVLVRVARIRVDQNAAESKNCDIGSPPIVATPSRMLRRGKSSEERQTNSEVVNNADERGAILVSSRAAEMELDTYEHGPRLTVNHEKKAPVWCGLNVLTSNMAVG